MKAVGIFVNKFWLCTSLETFHCIFSKRNISNARDILLITWNCLIWLLYLKEVCTLPCNSCFHPLFCAWYTSATKSSCNWFNFSLFSLIFLLSLCWLFIFWVIKFNTWVHRIVASHTHTHAHTQALTPALTFICIRTFYSIIKVSTLKVHCWNRPSEFRRRIRLLGSALGPRLSFGYRSPAPAR